MLGCVHQCPLREYYRQILNTIEEDTDEGTQAIRRAFQSEGALREFDRLDDTELRSQMIEEIYHGMRYLNGEARGHLEEQVLEFIRTMDQSAPDRPAPNVAPAVCGVLCGFSIWVTSIILSSNIMICAPMMATGCAIGTGSYVRLAILQHSARNLPQPKSVFLSKIEETPELKFPHYKEVFAYLTHLLKREPLGQFMVRELEEREIPECKGQDEDEQQNPLATPYPISEV